MILNGGSPGTRGGGRSRPRRRYPVRTPPPAIPELRNKPSQAPTPCNLRKNPPSRPERMSPAANPSPTGSRHRPSHAGHPIRVLLASSDPADADRIGKPIEVDNLNVALGGEAYASTTYSERLGHDAYEVLIPARDTQGHIIGAVRMTHVYESVEEQFIRLRYLILGVLVGGLLLGVGLGLELALTMERPLRRLTGALAALTTGERLSLDPGAWPGGGRATRRRVQLAGRATERARGVEADPPLQPGARAWSAARRAAVGESGPAPRRRRRTGASPRATLRHRGGASRTSSGCSTTSPSNRASFRLLSASTESQSHWASGSRARSRRGALWPTTKGLVWRADVPDELPTLEVDPDRLAQALGNLLSNAVRYTPAGGGIVVATTLEGSIVAIRVQRQRRRGSRQESASGSSGSSTAAAPRSYRRKAWGWAWPSPGTSSGRTAGASASSGTSDPARPSCSASRPEWRRQAPRARECRERPRGRPLEVPRSGQPRDRRAAS